MPGATIPGIRCFESPGGEVGSAPPAGQRVRGDGHPVSTGAAVRVAATLVPGHMRLRFGDCLFDEGARQVRRRGEEVDLSPKAFDLLGLLLAERPRVLSRAEIADRLWPQTIVSATSLPRVVSELRKALGDRAAQPPYVRTCYNHGYAFCGEALEDGATAAPGCTLLWAGLEIPMPDGPSLIGRADDCLVRLPSARVSRHHARLRVEGNAAWLEDLGSRNGTRIDGRLIEEATRLVEGDVIQIGPEVLVFLGPALPGPPTNGN